MELPRFEIRLNGYMARRLLRQNGPSIIPTGAIYHFNRENRSEGMKVGAVRARRVNGAAASHANDETSVLPPPRLAHVKNGESPPHDSIRMEIALVAGSTPHLSAETRDLLRSRLRIVAALLFACFLAYIARWVFHWSEWNDPIHHLVTF
jgi:hypothetical protein